MKTIISCTTTNNRLVFLYHTLISIAAQSLKPDLIIINISKERYLLDRGIIEIPESYYNTGLNIKVNWVPNCGSYRKLLPVIESLTDDDIIVTIDDDVIYHPDWFNNMIACCRENPEAVVAGRVRLIKRNFFGAYLNYDGWRIIKRREQGINLLPVGIDGVAYRKYLLDMEFLNDRSFLEISPKSDDLWFKMASCLKGTKVLYDPTIAEGNTYLLHKVGLQEENFIREKRNYFIMRRFQEIRRHIFKYIGLNQSNNDYSWDRIIRYIESTGKKCEI